MRVIELKVLVMDRYYRPTPEQIQRNEQLTEVPNDVEFDEATMLQRRFFYYENIMGIMSQVPNAEKGIMIDEMHKALEIRRALKETDKEGQLVLEDEQWAYLDSRVRTAPWPFISDAVEEFARDIHEAKAVSRERLNKAVATTDESDDESLNDKIMKSAPSLAPTPISKNGKSHREKVRH